MLCYQVRHYILMTFGTMCSRQMNTFRVRRRGPADESLPGRRRGHVAPGRGRRRAEVRRERGQLAARAARRAGVRPRGRDAAVHVRGRRGHVGVAVHLQRNRRLPF